MDTVISIIEYLELSGLILLFFIIPFVTIYLYKNFSTSKGAIKEHFDLTKFTLEIQKNTFFLMLKCKNLDLTAEERTQVKQTITKIDRKLMEFEI